MREIKFRAWDREKKKMITWQNEDASYCVALNGELRAMQHGTTPFTVTLPQNLKLMQFTGLHDKQGKEIYEGDIVKDVYFYKPEFSGSGYRRENIYEAKIPEMFLSIASSFTEEQTFEDIKKYCAESGKDYGLEVIGNIHENKELLNEN